MAEIERTLDRTSNGNGGADLNRSSGTRSRRTPASAASGSSRRGGGQRSNASGPAVRGRQFRGGGGVRGGGSRKAEARGGGADFFCEGDFSPSSGSESEYLHDYRATPLSSPAPGGAAQQHRFNVNAPSFRPSPASGGPAAPVSLTASAPGLSSFPLPHEVPAEEPRRREKKERRKMSRSDQFRVPANYLLNFTYERPVVHDWSTPARRRTPVVEFKKERFLQANYRFVVNAGGDYVRHLYETDQLVDWDEIEQIVLQTPVPYNCPICLDAPMAPKMTKCGHIYCWSCINRYLGMAQKGWRKCPICFDSVSTKHLKSTSIELVPEYHEGDSIKFTLMRRYKDCTVALPSAHWRPMETLLHHDDQDSNFSRLVLVEDITPILDKEQQDLNEVLAQSRALQDYEPVPYIEAALQALQERRQTFNAKKLEVMRSDKATELKASRDRSKSVGLSGSEGEHEEKERSKNNREHDAEEDADEEEGEHGAEKSDGGSAITSSPDIYYFYQASDGQNIFMHPLNFRCLHKEAGGSFDKLPLSIEAKVLQLEEITQNEKMRKRRKMIVGHLPLSTQFQFCEIELGELVSDKTVASFADEFKFRETKRAQLKRERGGDNVRDQAKPAVSQPSLVDDDPLLAAALEESRRLADAQAAAVPTGLAMPPVSIPTTPSFATMDTLPSAESPSSGLQGAWAKKQLTTATTGISSSSSSSRPVATATTKPKSGTPTFSQVASNAMWSGWKDEAFPTFEAATSGQSNGKKGGANGSHSSKSKDKKKVLLFSNAGSRRY